MGIEFREVQFPPLQGLTVGAPDRSIIGILGEKNSGATELLRLAAGLVQPVSGEVIAAGTRRYLGLSDNLNFAPVDLLVIDHTFAHADALVRGRALVSLDRLRGGGTTVLLATHERHLMQSICDEVWWLEAGNMTGRGEPREVLDAYYGRIADKLRAWGEKLSTPITPATRRGDGRAEITSLLVLGANGKPTAVLNSGEDLTVCVTVRFLEAVENSVVGIMIRTRTGIEVYGTNTELEKVRLGPYPSGETIRIDFHLRCDLGPRDYAVTVASHDADGTAHDWMEDAVVFQVTSQRQTAGVANLHASVHAQREITADQA